MNSIQECHIVPMWHFCYEASFDPKKRGHPHHSTSFNFFRKAVNRGSLSIRLSNGSPTI